jgi:hypothetical protein
MAPTPTQQLASFIARYDPAVAKLAKDALARLRKRLPGAYELVFDNYNALGIGFAPRDKGAVLSIVLYPRWVSFFFLSGARLPDPTKILKGSGSRVRHLVLQSAADIQSPPVEALITAALEQADWRIDPKRKRQVIIKLASEKRRPRRP